LPARRTSVVSQLEFDGGQVHLLARHRDAAAPEVYLQLTDLDVS
jgi:hypothetical protein